MKRFGWPRPPLILGLVLSSVLENYFFISASHFGASWLVRPIVLVIGALIVASLIYGRKWGQPGVAAAEPAPEASAPRFRFHLSVPAVFTVAIFLLVLGGVVTARGWPPQARLFPLVVGLSAVAMCAAQLLLDLFREPMEGAARIMDLEAERGVPGRIVARRAADIFGWIAGLLASIWVMGFLLSVPLFMWLYLALRAPRPLVALPRLHGARAGGSPGRVPLHPAHSLGRGDCRGSARDAAAVAGRLAATLSLHWDEMAMNPRSVIPADQGVKTASERGNEPPNRHLYVASSFRIGQLEREGCGAVRRFANQAVFPKTLIKGRRVKMAPFDFASLRLS